MPDVNQPEPHEHSWDPREGVCVCGWMDGSDDGDQPTPAEQQANLEVIRRWRWRSDDPNV